jgi:hypothetical protein
MNQKTVEDDVFKQVFKVETVDFQEDEKRMES